MSDVTIQVEELADTIERELTLYNKDVIDAIKKQTESSMKELVELTKATAPVGHRHSRHYRDSIRSKKETETESSVTYVWYVEGSNYRLSHLLNNGHALRNGGRYSGTQFIKTASDAVIEDYERKIEEVVQNVD